MKPIGQRSVISGQWVLVVGCWLLIGAGCVQTWGATYYVTVAGLGGEPDYEQRFTANAMDLDKIFKASVGAHVVTLTGKQATKARLNEAMAGVAREAKAEDDLVVTLIGHGSFDGVEYKFNLVGPDVSGAELSELCDRVVAKRQLIVDTSSASGGVVAALERPGRAVVAATKSGTEKNATVFARYWVEALQDPTADTDKSESISAAEAFAYADRKTVEFYASQKRLATEHAEFEDTGKGEPVRSAAGTTAGREGALMATLTVVRIGTAQAAMNDPAKRDLLTKKEELEQKIDGLKYQKAAMEPGEYKKELTAALVDLAKVQAELDK
ncbi:MAG TPA: hypothetical protein VF865_08345 [Acidobacteriaceae bacterium]